MTRKQMISTLRGMDFGTVIGSKGDEALRMAIRELEQQPCEDAISREDAKEIIAKNDKTNGTVPNCGAKMVEPQESED